MKLWAVLGLGLIFLGLLLGLPLGAEIRVRARWPRQIELAGRLLLPGPWTLGWFKLPPHRGQGGRQSSKPTPYRTPPGWQLRLVWVAVFLGLGDPALTAVASGWLQTLGWSLRSWLSIRPEVAVQPFFTGTGASLEARVAWKLRLWSLLRFVLEELVA